MRIEITTHELVAERNPIQPILSVLKSKGAPIRGSFWLRLEAGWDVRCFEQIETGKIIYEFNKRTRKSDTAEGER